MEKLYVIKIGGNIIDDEVQLKSFVANVAAIPHAKILVHGGGKLATRVAEALQIPQQMQDGRRITDADTLKVVTMVYAGAINKNIVALLQQQGCNALGLTGADGNLIKAKKRNPEPVNYGFVGDVQQVNTALAASLLQQNICLVCAPITHNAEGSLLNTNADTIAQEMAKAMSNLYHVSLIYCFEKKGVLRNARDDESVITQINPSLFEQLKADGTVNAGMLPKLQNAFDAISRGVTDVTIGHAAMLPQLIAGQAGTTIVP